MHHNSHSSFIRCKDTPLNCPNKRGNIERLKYSPSQHSFNVFYFFPFHQFIQRDRNRAGRVVFGKVVRRQYNRSQNCARRHRHHLTISQTMRRTDQEMSTAPLAQYSNRSGGSISRTRASNYYRVDGSITYAQYRFSR